METKFTKGPWWVQGSEIVSTADPICSLPKLHRGSREAKAILAADAHLIASSPDLYEALADCVNRLRSCARLHGNADWAVNALCEPFDSALARARGETA